MKNKLTTFNHIKVRFIMLLDFDFVHLFMLDSELNFFLSMNKDIFEINMRIKAVQRDSAWRNLGNMFLQFCVPRCPRYGTNKLQKTIPTFKRPPQNILSTYLTSGKKKTKVFFGQKNLPFLWPIKSNVIGSNCCDTISWTQTNTASVLVSGFHKRGKYFIYGYLL